LALFLTLSQTAFTNFRIVLNKRIGPELDDGDDDGDGDDGVGSRGGDGGGVEDGETFTTVVRYKYSYEILSIKNPMLNATVCVMVNTTRTGNIADLNIENESNSGDSV